VNLGSEAGAGPRDLSKAPMSRGRIPRSEPPWGWAVTLAASVVATNVKRISYIKCAVARVQER
jgi:hypothetical protein